MIKVGMFVVKTHHGHSERLKCMFICSGCSKPIKDIREANFAPPDDLADDPVRISRGLEKWTDRLEIFHWACDNGGTPWQNAAFGLADYLDAGLPQPLAVGRVSP